jgi:hypothetical protein
MTALTAETLLCAPPVGESTSLLKKRCTVETESGKVFRNWAVGALASLVFMHIVLADAFIIGLIVRGGQLVS